MNNLWRGWEIPHHTCPSKSLEFYSENQCFNSVFFESFFLRIAGWNADIQFASLIRSLERHQRSSHFLFPRFLFSMHERFDLLFYNLGIFVFVLFWVIEVEPSETPHCASDLINNFSGYGFVTFGSCVKFSNFDGHIVLSYWSKPACFRRIVRGRS